MNDKKNIQYADDGYESMGTLIRLRSPALVIGLILGIGISFVTSSFEEVLSQNVQVAFFMPFIIYIADAIGTQTEAIYSRSLKNGNARFNTYLRKEFLLGLIFGLVFGIFSALIILLWLGSGSLAAAVGVSSFIAVATAPLVALSVAQTFQSIRKDPAAGSGPIATVIQDVISVIIYGLVASAIIL